MLESMRSTLPTEPAARAIDKGPIPISQDVQNVLRDCHRLRADKSGNGPLKDAAEQALDYELWSTEPFTLSDDLERLLKRLKRLRRATRVVTAEEFVGLVRYGAEDAASSTPRCGNVSIDAPRPLSTRPSPKKVEIDKSYDAYRRMLRTKAPTLYADEASTAVIRLSYGSRDSTAQVIKDIFGESPEKRTRVEVQQQPESASRREALAARRWEKASLEREQYVAKRLEDTRKKLAEMDAAKVSSPRAVAEACLDPLTDEENALVDDALEAPSIELISEAFNVELKGVHSSTLQPGFWLVDEVINFYMALLKDRDSRFCKLDPERKPSHFFNSFFITKLMGANSSDYNYDGVRRWTKKFDLFSCRIAVAPVNISNVHWCLVVMDFENKTIRYYDSMGSAGMQYLRALRRYLDDEHRDKKKTPFDGTGWELVPSTKDTPKQQNSFDCGVFASYCAHYLAVGADPTFSQANMPHFRRRMLADLINKRLHGPPSDNE